MSAYSAGRTFTVFTPGLREKIPVFSDPAPGKSSTTTYAKWISEQPSPWRKSSKRKSCFGDRVYQRNYHCRSGLHWMPSELLTSLGRQQLVKLPYYNSSQKNMFSFRIPFGDHPLTSERHREDYHGPCARMTTHKSRIANNLNTKSNNTCQSYTSKDIRRQGIGSFVRNSYVSTLCPVVICPYLCTSENGRVLHRGLHHRRPITITIITIIQQQQLLLLILLVLMTIKQLN